MELVQCGVVTVGVFADIHGGQMEPEGGHIAHEPQQDAVGNEPSGMGPQRALHYPQFLQQALARPVVAPGHMAGILGKAAAGVDQPLVDKGALETVRLVAVERVEALPHVRQRHPVGCQGGGQLVCYVSQS